MDFLSYLECAREVADECMCFPGQKVCFPAELQS